MADKLDSAPLPTTVWQKYDHYDCHTDVKQGDRSTQFKPWSVKRPHMRAFHVAWIGFFSAFVCWFSFASLMPEVKKSLHLKKAEVANANILSVTSTVIARFAVGPIADAWGGRLAQSLLLVLGSIPTACSGLVNSATDLIIVRFFIGFIGATFVCVQCWMTNIFAKEIVGTANATAAGWGNFGGGLTQILMVWLWKALTKIHSKETAWRVSFLIPASATLLVGLVSWMLADDTPKGNYNELIRRGALTRKSSSKSLKQGASNRNTWLLAIHYACSFGMELTVFNNLATYYHDRYKITTVRAGGIASIFGLLNFVTRAAGGIYSDIMCKAFGGGEKGLRGRLIAHWSCLLIEGIFLIIFSKMESLNASIGIAVLFAVGTEMANGTIYGIVPYVIPGYSGSVSGIVGAGGNPGAVVWGLIFRFGPSKAQDTWAICGYIITACSFLTPLIMINGYNSCLMKARGEPDAIDVI